MTRLEALRVQEVALQVLALARDGVSIPSALENAVVSLLRARVPNDNGSLTANEFIGQLRRHAATGGAQ